MKRFSRIISIVMFVSLAVPAHGANFGASFWSSAKKPLVGIAAGMGALFGYYLYDTAQPKKVKKQAIKAPIQNGPTEEEIKKEKTCKFLEEFMNKYSVINGIDTSCKFRSTYHKKSLHSLKNDDLVVFDTEGELFVGITQENKNDAVNLCNRTKNNIAKLIQNHINTADNYIVIFNKVFAEIVKDREELIRLVDMLLAHHENELSLLRKTAAVVSPSTVKKLTTPYQKSEKNSALKRQRIAGVSCIIASLAAGLWYIFKK